MCKVDILYLADKANKSYHYWIGIVTGSTAISAKLTNSSFGLKLMSVGYKDRQIFAENCEALEISKICLFCSTTNLHF